MEFITPTFNVSTIISLGLSLYLIVTGLIQLFTGKVFGDYSRYTTESVEKYARPAGLLFFLVGALIVSANFINIPTLGDSTRLTLYGACCVALIIYVIISIIILKKKGK